MPGHGRGGIENRNRIAKNPADAGFQKRIMGTSQNKDVNLVGHHRAKIGLQKLHGGGTVKIQGLDAFDQSMAHLLNDGDTAP